jgi:hypothetical protein
MKPNNKRFSFFIAAFLLAAVLNGCEKDASSQAFGNDATQIYMPQATIANLMYAVPAGLDSATYNYKIDAVNNKVNIILGVTASGAHAPGNYTVNVVANTDTINQMITNGVLPAATTQVLPAGIYTLPQTVSVPAGQTAASFYLSIDETQLKTYAGETLGLEVVLNNPSQYVLNTTINKTIILINVSALNLP